MQRLVHRRVPEGHRPVRLIGHAAVGAEGVALGRLEVGDEVDVLVGGARLLARRDAALLGDGAARVGRVAATLPSGDAIGVGELAGDDAGLGIHREVDPELQLRRQRHLDVDHEEVRAGEEHRARRPLLARELVAERDPLPDVDAAILNNDFVADAGLTFEDAIAQDDPSDPNALPYVNIFAARAEDADNETYLKLVEIFQTNKDVQAGLLESSGDTAVALQTPVEDLLASLKKVEKDTADQK